MVGMRSQITSVVLVFILTVGISVRSFTIAQEENEIGLVREVAYDIPSSNLLLEYYLHWIPDYEYDNFAIAKLTCVFSNIGTGHYVKIDQFTARLTERIYDSGWFEGQVIKDLTHSSTDNIRFHENDRETFEIFASGQFHYDGENTLFLDLNVRAQQYDENSEPVGFRVNVWDNYVSSEDCPIVDLNGQIPPPQTTSNSTGVFSPYTLAMYIVIIVCIILIVLFTFLTLTHSRRKSINSSES